MAILRILYLHHKNYILVKAKHLIHCAYLFLYQSLKRNNYFFIFSLLFIAFSCKRVSNFKTYSVDGNKIEGNFFKEIPDGPIKYYDRNGNLRKIIHYKMGEKEGSILKFFPNGKISDSVTYHSNMAEGYWNYYDSSGNILFSNYYYKNLEYGPLLWYQNNRILRFEFLSFEKKAIASAYYKIDGHLDSINYFKMGLNLHEKNTREINLFAYLPKLPKIEQHFAIGITNK